VFLDQYFSSVDDVFARVRETQRARIIEAAEALADAIAQRGVLAVMDTGHLLKYEALMRAGGLVGIFPFAYELQVENEILGRKTERSESANNDLEMRKAELALDASNLRSGDVLLINSNSGRTTNVIEVALQCKPRGIRTIGLASHDQSTRCTSAHPSGKKLLDIVDIPIDNGTPYGDAVLEIPDNERICPLSGLSSAYILWAIQAHAVELLQARGIQPTIYRSVHVSGMEHVEQQRARYAERGQ